MNRVLQGVSDRTPSFTACVLGSGSKGNSIYIRAGGTAMLVDAGFSYRQLTARLAAIGVDPGDIRHIFITHEHTDHISALKLFTKNHAVTLHLNAGTHRAIGHEIPKRACVHVFNKPFALGPVAVHPFPTPHDAVEPVGYAFIYEGFKVSIATDLGHGSLTVIDAIRNSHAMILESNHDESMLWNGPYSWPLKQRIAGPKGHLSNLQAAQVLKAVHHPELRYVFLAHLSQENNHPKLAFDSVFNYLEETFNTTGTQLLMTRQDTVSPTIRL